MKFSKYIKDIGNGSFYIESLSDTNEKYEIWNSVLHVNIAVSNEKLETGRLGYMAEFVYNGVYYYLSGVMERNDFDEMLKKIHF